MDKNEEMKNNDDCSCHWESRSRVKTFCIIASEGLILTKENEIQTDDLALFLTSHQYIYSLADDVRGMEQSFFIYNISLGSAMAIGQRFLQEHFVFAIIDGERKRYTFQSYLEGCNEEYRKVDEETRIISSFTEEADFFVTIGRKFKVDMRVEPFENGVRRLNELINERCKRYEEYRTNYEVWIRESISEGKTAKSQRLKRAVLYGKNYEKFFK